MKNKNMSSFKTSRWQLLKRFKMLQASKPDLTNQCHYGSVQYLWTWYRNNTWHVKGAGVVLYVQQEKARKVQLNRHEQMSLMHAVLHLYMKYEAKIETKVKWVNLRGQSQTIETPVSQSPEVGEAEQRGTKDSTTPTLRAGNLWENITIHTFRPTCLIFCLISEPVRPMKTFSCCWHILFHSSLEPWLIWTLFLVSALFPCFLLTCRDFYLASCFF